MNSTNNTRDFAREPKDANVRRQVIEPDGSYAVQAPAGSGKTELLTQRFLRLLATVEQPQQVLAITFTRKATRVMLNRILRHLRLAWAAQPPEEAHERTTYDLARAVMEQDRRQGWDLLGDPAQLQIHTIDGFCARLAMRGPEQPLSVANLTVTDAPEPLYREAARRALQSAAAEPEGTPIRGALEGLLLRERGNANALEALLAQMLPKRDQWLGDVVRQAAQGRELLTIRQEAELQALEEALGAEALTKVGNDVALLSELADDPSLGDELRSAWNAPDRAADIGQATEAVWRVLMALGTQKRLLMSPVRLNSQVFPGDSSDRKGIIDRLKEQVEYWKADEKACAAYQRFCTHPPLDLVPENRGLLSQLRELLKLSCAELHVTFAERSVCDFPHVAQQALSALGDELAPSEALLIEDGRLSHILVDEFQDTSRLQYDLISKLVSGWTPRDGRTVFLVGDPMQSIYGFRKANVGLFRQLMEDGHLGDVPIEPCRLAVNFRSTRPVIDDVNATCASLFQASSKAALGHVDYQPVEAFRGTAGDVSTRAFLADEQVDAAREAEARWVAEDIDAHLALEDVETVGVLARTRSRLEPIAQALDECGIRYEAVEVNALGQRPLVLDLLTITRALLHPGDRVAWVALLTAPWCGLQPAELLTLLGPENTADPLDRCQDPDRLAQLGAKAGQRVERLGASFEQIRRQATVLPLARRVETAWVSVGGPRLANRSEDLEDAERFLALLARTEQDQPEDLLGELERRLPRLFASSTSAPVQLMTIHKAKGLEFDAVYLPALQATTRGSERVLFRQQEINRNDDEPASLLAPVKASGNELPSLYDYLGLLEQDAQTSEAQRLFYVAMTRARKYLRLSAVVQKKKDGGLVKVSGSFLGLLHDRFEALLSDAEPVVAQEQRVDDAQPIFRFESTGKAVFLESVDEDVSVSEEPVVLGEAMPERDRLALGEALHHWFELMHDFWDDRWLGDWFPAYGPALRSSLRIAGASDAHLDALHDELISLLRERLADPEFRAMLSPENKRESFAEASYLVPDGDRLRRQYIDRLYRDHSGDWHIVDYKTGRDSEQSRALWSKQLGGYRSAVAEAEGGEVVEASILTAADGRFIDPDS